MKNFLQEYGTAILACCMTIMMIGVASPVSETIQVSTGEVVASFSDKVTGEEEGGGMRALDSAFVSSGVMEENVPDTIYVGYNSLNRCLVFSHSDNSSGYAACNTKYGNCNIAYDVNNSGIEINSYTAANIEYSTSAPPWIYAYDNQCTKILIENNIKPKSMSKWFYNLHNLESIDGISKINTSNCIDMSGTFCGCTSLESVDVSTFNTSNVETFYATFSACSNLQEINGISNFNTNKCVYIGNMFQGCLRLESLDLSSFDTSNVGAFGFSSVFANCQSLSTLTLGNFDTSNTQYLNHMFQNCKSLTSLDLSSFNVGAHILNANYMFQNCSKLTTINYGSNFGKPKKYTSMFDSCPANKPSWW